MSPGRTGDPRVAAGFGAVAWAWRERRDAAADAATGSSCGSARTRRRTTGETRELANYVAGQPTRRRFAGGETWTGGAFAEATAELGRVTLSGGARLDHWQVSDGHCSRRSSRPARCSATTIMPSATAGCRRRAAACWPRSAAAQPALGRLSRLAHADPQRAVPAVSRGRSTRPPPIPSSIPSGSPARKPASNMPMATCALSLTAFVNRLKRRDRQRQPGAGARHVSRRRLRRRRRHLPPAAECRCGEGPRNRSIGGMDARTLVGARRREPDPCADARRAAPPPFSTAFARPRHRNSRHARRGLGAGRQGRGARPAPRRRAVRGRPQFANLEGRDDPRRLCFVAAAAAVQLIARGENITNELVMAASTATVRSSARRPGRCGSASITLGRSGCCCDAAFASMLCADLQIRRRRQIPIEQLALLAWTSGAAQHAVHRLSVRRL